MTRANYCSFNEPFAFYTKPCGTPTLNKFQIPCSSTKSYPQLSYGHEKKSQYTPSSNSKHVFQKARKNLSLQPEQSPCVGKVEGERQQLDPLGMLKEDGDWSEEQFRGVIKFLYQNSRTTEIPQVFDLWKNVDKSRINVENYEKMIDFLLKDRLMDAAIKALKQMKSYGIGPSLEIYKLVINGFARIGQFDDVFSYLKEMKDTGLNPDTEIYDGLIRAYGKYKMFDEMGRCLREMELDGCSPDHLTYNLLVREYAKAGLINKMERTYQALLTKKMDVQTSTLIAMLETYANFGILDKMEKVFRRAMYSKAYIEEELVQKLARVYIENLMFSRLDDLGLDFSSKTGNIDLVWCLRLLSHACVLRKKGMYSIIEEMESKEVPWSVTIANILALACLKMKDFKQLQVLLCELPARYVNPDIITVGVLFDACMCGFNGASVKRIWARAGYFDDAVELKTDALVLSAFGKGKFLKDFEELYLVEAKTKKLETWTYRHLINLVKTHGNARLVVSIQG
ncbi:OLC1v1018923C1 [Oldenlandia corymbosa var. corymbosa]|uniref:OLC1v1018923C1 n=1 Tax=Oldenlandia corymbosa var. corymbosa TaxID=529605 RepID=A0AAV1ECT9_OLDCO|nr:OLC1v1018923C1 [Oldenlandia corymbosa var. corymbosa]